MNYNVIQYNIIQFHPGALCWDAGDDFGTRMVGKDPLLGVTTIRTTLHVLKL